MLPRILRIRKANGNPSTPLVRGASVVATAPTFPPDKGGQGGFCPPQQVPDSRRQAAKQRHMPKICYCILKIMLLCIDQYSKA